MPTTSEDDLDAQVLKAADATRLSLASHFRRTGHLAPYVALWNRIAPDGSTREQAARDKVDIRQLVETNAGFAVILASARGLALAKSAEGALWCAVGDMSSPDEGIVFVVAETRRLGVRAWTARFDKKAERPRLEEFKSATLTPAPSILPPLPDPLARN